MNPAQHIKELQDSALDKCVVECERQATEKAIEKANLIFNGYE